MAAPSMPTAPLINDAYGPVVTGARGDHVTLGATASTLTGFGTPASENSQAGMVLSPRSVRKVAAPKWAAVIVSREPDGGAEEPGPLLADSSTVNAASALMTA